MSYYSALRWTRLMMVSGLSRSEALESVDYPLELPPELSRSELIEHLYWKLEACRFSLRQRARQNFWRFGPVTIWVALLWCFYAGHSLAFSPFVPLFDEMNLSLPVLTKWLREPDWWLIFATALPLSVPFLRRTTQSERQVKICTQILEASVQALPECLLTERRLLGLALTLNSSLEKGNFRESTRAWARCVEWDVQWTVKRARCRRVLTLLFGSALILASCALAASLPFYRLIG